jgi:hypothetical protein
LDWILIVNCRHLQSVLREFVNHYNGHRPHRALGLAPPEPRQPPPTMASPPVAPIRSRDLLGGFIHPRHRAERARHQPERQHGPHRLRRPGHRCCRAHTREDRDEHRRDGVVSGADNPSVCRGLSLVVWSCRREYVRARGADVDEAPRPLSAKRAHSS